jgi:serine/threonine protein kinase
MSSLLETENILLTEEHFVKVHGFEFSISGKVLGHGSYGKVFEVEDKFKNLLAVKICSLDKHFNPLEASIMNSYIHPNINRSILTLVIDRKIYLFQARAVSDLLQETRNYKIRSIRKLFKWCLQVARALFVLHKDGIIHGDLKANNILLFNNDEVKITDFSLSKLVTKKTNSIVHSTPYRPLECFLGKEVDQKADIWALGCTFYEIAYGSRLFQTQKDEQKKPYINALLDWARRKPMNKEKIDMEFFKEDFEPFKLSNSFNEKKFSTFNDLILKMLTVDKERRISIEEVLQHPFFNNAIVENFFFLDFPTRELSEKEKSLLMDLETGMDQEEKKAISKIITRFEEELSEHDFFTLRLLVKKIFDRNFLFNLEEIDMLKKLNFRIHRLLV